MDLLNAIALVLGILGTVCSIIFGYALFRRNNKSDDNSEGKQAGIMLSEIGYIKSGVDDIKRKQDTQDTFNLKIMAEITSARDSAASAHKRIDGLEERLNHGKDG